MSILYFFDVFCLSARKAPLDPDCVGRRAALTIAPDGTRPREVRGLVTAITILRPALFDQVVYRIGIAPSLSQLALGRHNRI
jgi:uncharacterized protein involved in type VI secretion and phage assembly